MELVVLDRQRASRELRERARRVIGAVEVQIDDAVVRERRVEKASGFVGFRSARQVLEDEEQTAARRHFALRPSNHVLPVWRR